MNLRRTEAQTRATLADTRTKLAISEGERDRDQYRLSLLTTTASQGVRGGADCQCAAKLSLASDKAFSDFFYQYYFSDYLWQKGRAFDRKAVAAREICVIGKVPSTA